MKFFIVISQKKILTQLKVHFTLDHSYSTYSYEEKVQIMTLLFYKQILPTVTKMLQLHTTIRLLIIDCDDLNNEKSKSSHPNWIEILQHFYEIIFIHPLLEYVEIDTVHPFLKDTFKAIKKALIAMNRQH